MFVRPNPVMASICKRHQTSLVLEDKPDLDIEHALVEDDPRGWSDARKYSEPISAANAQIQQELRATSGQISLTVSLSVLVQGNVPLLWSAMSEIKGRKLSWLYPKIYGWLLVCAWCKQSGMAMLHVMRPSSEPDFHRTSAIFTIGAATLADIYDPYQRGTMMGIYASAPLLGPSLGPILGGVLAQELSWRAIFWFLAIWGGIVFLAFLSLFRDTFRRERSLTYQNVLKRRTCQQQLSKAKVAGNTKQMATGNPEDVKDVTLSLTNVNPLPPYVKILCHKNNFAILIASVYYRSFSITYSCARTLALYYHYDALKTGLALLSFGIGSTFGSISRGRWSDRTLARLRVDNGGVSYPEMRLESTKVLLWWLPPSVIGYAWVCQEHVHIAVISVMLCLIGFFSMSSSAAAANASFRGTIGFIAVEVAVPLQDNIGDGGLYMIWAGLMLFAELLVLLVLYKGKQWREANVKKEKE
ncbi:major facilitator superfamily domain-containing protein [Scleroderma yunnanense]